MNDDHFITVSAELTGFEPAELRATGLAEEYRTVVLERAGAEQLRRLTAAVTAHGGPSAADEPLRELARALVQLWYCGSWPTVEGPSVVSARSYEQGLVWRSFGGRPPGTAARGYGSWSTAPGPR